MRTKIITEGNKVSLMVQVQPNISYGFISRTGKSFVFRVNGTYLKSNGEIIGREGSMTGYIHNPFPYDKVEPVRSRQHYGKNDIVKFEFEKKLIVSAIKIPLIKNPS